ncbi:hypothetical protein TNCV_4172941 [Trichonephila clavipes]|nr:hypothetical protein TNCV_4172941 [Trichonephila clavipes]
MITNFFIPELNNHDVQELWFQQDGATCHTARATIDLLKDTFGDRLISRFRPVNWPPRSCDLTPLDYFLWGYVKSLVYADKPQTLDHLEDNIRRVIADIRPQMLEKVIENWTSRLDYIRASRGSHMPEIIFKMRFLSGVWTVNSPQSHIVRVYDAGHGKSGVFHTAEWHDGDWSSDGIREAWLWFFIWVESLSFLAWLRAKRLLSDWMLGTVNIDSDWLPRGLRLKLWGGACPVGRAGENF